MNGGPARFTTIGLRTIWRDVDPDLRVTISVGLDSDMSRASISDMLAAADERLYDAKHGGRNRVVAQPAT